MTEPLHHLGDAFCPQPPGQLRPRDHDDRQTQFARRVDLGARALPAGIAGHDPFDPPRTDQIQLIGEQEWTTGDDDVRIGKWQRAIGRVDEPQCIDVLRFASEWRDVLPADREEYARGLDRQRRDSGCDIRDLDPSVAGTPGPRRALQRDQRRLGCTTGRNGIASDLDGERMRRVDDVSDGLAADVVGQSARPAKAADTNRHGLAGRRARAAAIGIDRVNPGLGERLGQRMGFRRSAQNEGACHG